MSTIVPLRVADSHLLFIAAISRVVQSDRDEAFRQVVRRLIKRWNAGMIPLQWIDTVAKELTTLAVGIHTPADLVQHFDTIEQRVRWLVAGLNVALLVTPSEEEPLAPHPMGVPSQVMLPGA